MNDANIGPVVVEEIDLQQRIQELGKDIASDYAAHPPLLVGILKGAFMFMADLARAIDLPVEFDFMAVSSYGSATRTSGVVRIMKDLDLDLTDRHVLIVEDIVDSGLTLAYLRKNLRARNPASLEVCALLVKEGLQKTDPDLKYVGFTIPNRFVIGYGLDVDERYRNLPFVAEYAGDLRAGMTVDQERIERAVREILSAIGEDPNRDGLLRTPARVAEMYSEICSGLNEDPAKHLVVTFEADHDEMVLVRDIALYSICVPSKQKVNAVGGAKPAAAVEVGDWLWTFDDDGRLAQTQVVSAGWRNARELVEFRVGSRSVRLTPEHPVMTTGGWVEAGALIAGEKVQAAEPRRLCQTRFEVNEGYELGYALGAVGSDGSIQDGRRISFVVNDLSFAERYARSLSVAFGVESKIEPIEVPSGFLQRPVQTYRVRTVSRHIASMMLHWFGGSKATKEFHFPRVVLRSLEMAKGFIDGYCDGDGHELKSPKGARYIISANLGFLDELAVVVGSHPVVDRRGVGKVYVSRLWYEARTAYGRKAFEPRSVPLLPPDEGWTEIESVKRVKAEGTTPFRVYSFECSPYPTFLVGGVQTHNCEHHLVPFHGHAHVAYIPNEDGRITGLSKLARLVDGFAKRPQVQERLTTQIADALVDALAPRGAFVMIEAEHLCMSMRGVRKPGTLTVTSAVRGLFKDSVSTRAEVMAMLAPLGARR